MAVPTGKSVDKGKIPQTDTLRRRIDTSSQNQKNNN